LILDFNILLFLLKFRSTSQFLDEILGFTPLIYFSKFEELRSIQITTKEEDEEFPTSIFYSISGGQPFLLKQIDNETERSDEQDWVDPFAVDLDENGGAEEMVEVEDQPKKSEIVGEEICFKPFFHDVSNTTKPIGGDEEDPFSSLFRGEHRQFDQKQVSKGKPPPSNVQTMDQLFAAHSENQIPSTSNLDQGEEEEEGAEVNLFSGWLSLNSNDPEEEEEEEGDDDHHQISSQNEDNTWNNNPTTSSIEDPMLSLFSSDKDQDHQRVYNPFINSQNQDSSSLSEPPPGLVQQHEGMFNQKKMKNEKDLQPPPGFG